MRCFQVLLENARRLARKPGTDITGPGALQPQGTWYQGLVDWFSAPARERFDQAKEAGRLCNAVLLHCSFSDFVCFYSTCLGHPMFVKAMLVNAV